MGRIVICRSKRRREHDPMGMLPQKKLRKSVGTVWAAFKIRGTDLNLPVLDARTDNGSVKAPNSNLKANQKFLESQAKDGTPRETQQEAQRSRRLQQLKPKTELQARIELQIQKRREREALDAKIKKANQKFLESQAKDGTLRETQQEAQRSRRLQQQLKPKKTGLQARIELQIQRRREREALDEMEKTVVVEDNLKSLKELERLCYCSSGRLFFDKKLGCPLQQLGLYLKPGS